MAYVQEKGKKQQPKTKLYSLLLTHCVLRVVCFGMAASWETLAPQVLEAADVHLWQQNFSQDFYSRCIPPCSHLVLSSLSGIVGCNATVWSPSMQKALCLLLRWCHYSDSDYYPAAVILWRGGQRLQSATDLAASDTGATCEVPPRETVLSGDPKRLKLVCVTKSWSVFPPHPVFHVSTGFLHQVMFSLCRSTTRKTCSESAGFFFFYIYIYLWHRHVAQHAGYFFIFFK